MNKSIYCKTIILRLLQLLSVMLPCIASANSIPTRIDTLLVKASNKELLAEYRLLDSQIDRLTGEQAIAAQADLTRIASRLIMVDKTSRHFMTIKSNAVNTSEAFVSCNKAYIDFSTLLMTINGRWMPLSSFKDEETEEKFHDEPVIMRRLGIILESVRSHSDAIYWFQKGFENCKGNSVDRMTLLLDIINCYIQNGDYEKASKYIADTEQTGLSVFSGNSLLHVHLLLLKARLARLLGNTTDAARYIVRGLEMIERNDWQQSMLKLYLLKESGIISMVSGDFETAYTDFDRYYQGICDTGNNESPLALEAIAYTMESLSAQGRLQEMKAIQDKTDIQKYMTKGAPFQLFYLSRYYNACASGMMLDNAPSLAAKIWGVSLDFYTQLEIDDPLELRNLNNSIGYALLLSNMNAEASEHFIRQLELDRRFAHDTFLFLPESQRSVYWARTEPYMNRLFALNREGSITLPDGNVTALTASIDDSKTGALLYDASLLNKGLMMQASVNLNNLLASSDDTTLSVDSRQLAGIRAREARGEQISADDLKLADELERRIIIQSRQYGDFMEFTGITWQKIRDRLNDGETAIEFVRSRIGDIQYYSAEVIRKDYEFPKHIFLFGLKDGDKRFDKKNIYDSSTIYSRVWKKILALTSPGETIYFSPAGKLYNLAIEHALTPDGRRLNEVYNPVRLSSTREILHHNQPVTSPNVLVYGGLNYDMGIDEMELMAMENGMDRGVTHFDGRELSDRNAWNFLPGTLEESTTISKCINKTDKWNGELITGDSGTEENIKRVSEKKADILHIATHGFYIPENNVTDVQRAEYIVLDNSLQRSALVMSGGNNGWLFPELIPEGVDDGILTAAEIARMSFRNKPLVVMSACQTGLGDISNEGVFGLQRAFKLAGAGTIIMSLSPVNDQATCLLMKEFYTSLTNGKSTRHAFSEAQEAVKKAEFNIDGQKIKGSDPRFWAPFVVMD